MAKSTEPDDPFESLRATPDKVWETLLNIHGELREIRVYQSRLATQTERIEGILVSLKRLVQAGLALAVFWVVVSLLR